MKRILFAAAVLAATPATAQQQSEVVCAPTDAIREVLKQLKQVEVSGGMVSETAIFSIFASPDGDQWTLVATDTSGKSCILSGGRYWFQGKIPASGETPA